MNLLELSKLLLDEKLAEQYLLEKGILKTFTNCEKCGSEKIGRIRRQRYKCYGCKSEWGIRKGSILHAQSISSSKFMGLVKCFELELPAQNASREIETNLKTAKSMYYNIRLAITDLKAEDIVNLKEMITKETPKFSITSTDGEIKIDYKKTMNGYTDLLQLNRTRIPNKEVSFTFQFSKLRARKLDSKYKSFPIQINYFWRFARKRLLSYRGTQLDYLFLFLKEIEFRFNSNNEILFDKIVEKLAKFNGWQIGVAHDHTKK